MQVDKHEWSDKLTLSYVYNGKDVCTKKDVMRVVRLKNNADVSYHYDTKTEKLTVTINQKSSRAHANPDNPNGNEFGSANRETVSINLSNIDNGVKNGFNKSQLIEGTFLHEIGHNLGLDHTDNSTIMDKPTKHIQNQNGQTNMYVTYPVIDKTGIGLKIMRDNTNRIISDVILGAINKK